MSCPLALARSGLAAALVAGIVLGTAGGAAADAPAAAPDYFANQPDPDEMRLREDLPRSRSQKLLIAGLAAGAVVSGGLGVWFHLDSRDAASEVSINGDNTGLPWTVERQATYDRAYDSRTLAIVGYACSAAFIGATVVTLMLTDPGDREITVPSHARAPMVAPVPGGAVVGGAFQW